MQKTKMGLSVGFIAGLVWFAGLLEYQWFLAIAIVFLVLESDTWLKKSIVSAIIVNLCIWVINFSLYEVLFGFIYKIITDTSGFSIFDSWTSYILLVTKNIFMMLMGIKAFKGQETGFSVLDTKSLEYVGDKNLYMAKGRCCPNCGKAIKEDEIFCTKCGYKVQE